MGNRLGCVLLCFIVSRSLDHQASKQGHPEAYRFGRGSQRSVSSYPDQSAPGALMQDRGGRRGSVFSVRLTDEQRLQLERLRRRVGGPRAMGPWLVWQASRCAGSAVPESAGAALPAQVLDIDGVLPARAKRSARDGTTRARLILDLCGGSGAWSEPYRRAGYDVRIVSLERGDDVRTYEPPKDRVHGILAAPPCTEFSLAKNGRPRDIKRGLEVVGACLRVVGACLRVVSACNPVWWALENPVGMLGHYLGTPRDVFEPCDFGDPWTKRTAIWGDFSIPERGPFVKPLGGGPLCSICDPQRKRLNWCGKAAHRAITPPGFARAFFEANP